MTTTTHTLKQLARKVRIELTGGASLDWDKQDDWQRNANGYRCILHYKKRQYTFDFWQGIGISNDPTAEGCLSCLLSDANLGEYPFGKFCGEMGLYTDSRTAVRTWRACQGACANMRRLLGDDFDTFMCADR